MQTAVSILALALSVASLTWQFVTFALTGGRVKVELRVGAFPGGGRGLVHAAAKDWGDVWGKLSGARPVIVVHVRHTGRMAVTVERCNLVMLREEPPRKPGVVTVSIGRPERLATITPLESNSVIGPAWPHRMEPGSASQMWCIDAGFVIEAVAKMMTVYGVKTAPIVAEVELGDGRVYATREKLLLKP